MDGKVFRKDLREKLAQMADDALKLPFWAEPFDKKAFNRIIDYIDRFGDKYIPDSFDATINDAVEMALDGHYEEAILSIGEAIDNNIDIDVLPDEIEALMFIDGAKFIGRFVQTWADKQRKKV